MSTVAGVVEAVSNKFGKTSLLVNGGWYGTKFGISPMPNKGDEVEFDDGGGKFINKLRITGGTIASGGTPTPLYKERAAGFPVPIDTKDRSIVRQNSLGHATSLVVAFTPFEEGLTWEERKECLTNLSNLIVEVARVFEDYSCGDSDMEEATKELKGS